MTEVYLGFGSSCVLDRPQKYSCNKPEVSKRITKLHRTYSQKWDERNLSSSVGGHDCTLTRLWYYGRGG